MLKIQTYRNKWLRSHNAYTRRAFRIFEGVFIAWGLSIPFDELTPDNYKALIALSTDLGLMDQGYIEVYTKVGLVHGRKVGISINNQLKVFEYDDFRDTYIRDLPAWMRTNLSARIITVRRTYLEAVYKILESGIANNTPMAELVKELQKAVKQRNFYGWQALRIARTETTGASNYGASVAGRVSGFVMQKMWISALDNRTRRPPKSDFDHYTMNQVRVGQFEKFNVSGDLLAYPGDPQGQAGNVINCRCTVALVPQRDRNGSLIRVA